MTLDRTALCALRPAHRWGLAELLCASVGPRRGRSAHRWGLAGAALRIAGASQGELWVSLRRRWGPAGAEGTDVVAKFVLELRCAKRLGYRCSCHVEVHVRSDLFCLSRLLMPLL